VRHARLPVPDSAPLVETSAPPPLTRCASPAHRLDRPGACGL